MQLQIEAQNVELSPTWKADIEDRVSKLHTGHDDIIHGRVTLTKDLHHHQTHNGAEVLIVVSISGRHTITARKSEKTFEAAIRAAFAAMQAELRKYREKRASKTIRVSSPPLRGVISKIFLQQGYGFILQEGGGELYFHRHAVHGLKFEELEDGLEVAFNVEEGEQGLQATTVNPVSAELL